MYLVHLALLHVVACVDIQVEGDVAFDIRVGDWKKGKGKTRFRHWEGGKQEKELVSKMVQTNENVTAAPEVECIYQYPENKQVNAVLSNMMNELTKVFVRAKAFINGEETRRGGVHNKTISEQGKNNALNKDSSGDEKNYALGKYSSRDGKKGRSGVGKKYALEKNSTGKGKNDTVEKAKSKDDALDKDTSKEEESDVVETDSSVEGKNNANDKDTSGEGKDNTLEKLTKNLKSLNSSGEEKRHAPKKDTSRDEKNSALEKDSSKERNNHTNENTIPKEVTPHRAEVSRFKVVDKKNKAFFEVIYSNMTKEYKDYYNSTVDRVDRSGRDPCVHQDEVKQIWRDLLDHAVMSLKTATYRCMEEYFNDQHIDPQSKIRSRLNQYLTKELSKARADQLEMLCDVYQLCYNDLLK